MSNEYEGSRVVVTGGTGFIGRHLVQALLKKGAQVAVLSLDPPSNKEHSSVEYLTCSITEAESVRKYFSAFSPDVVFHLAARLPSAYAQFDELLAVNLEGTRTVIAATLASGAKRLIAIGSMDEYGSAPVPHKEDAREEPYTEYGLSKLFATRFLEYIARDNALSITVVRPPIVYGPGQSPGMLISSCMAHMLARTPFSLERPNDRRDFLFVQDLIQLLCLAGQRDGSFQIVNAGGGKSTALRDVAYAIADLFDGRALLSFETPKVSAQEPPERLLAIGKARTLFSWSPTTDIQIGLKETARLFKVQ